MMGVDHGGGASCADADAAAATAEQQHDRPVGAVSELRSQLAQLEAGLRSLQLEVAELRGAVHVSTKLGWVWTGGIPAATVLTERSREPAPPPVAVRPSLANGLAPGMHSPRTPAVGTQSPAAPTTVGLKVTPVSQHGPGKDDSGEAVVAATPPPARVNRRERWKSTTTQTVGDARGPAEPPVRTALATRKIRKVSAPRKRHRATIVSFGAHAAVVLLLALAGFSHSPPPATIEVESVFAVRNEEPLTEVEMASWSEPQAISPVPLPSGALQERQVSVDVLAPSLAADVATPSSAHRDGEPSWEALSAEVVGSASSEFFGVKAAGNSFVYLVDSSGSMNDGRLALAKRELLHAVEHLGGSGRFYVIFYDQNVERMRLGESTSVAERPVFATRENLTALRNWLPHVRTERGRHPMEVLEIALEMLPDAIYLLSDGDFPDWVLEQTQAANVIDEPAFGRRPLVPIHTIAILPPGSRVSDDLPFARRMERLAAENGGEFRALVAPPSLPDQHPPSRQRSSTRHTRRRGEPEIGWGSSKQWASSSVLCLFQGEDVRCNGECNLRHSGCVCCSWGFY